MSDSLPVSASQIRIAAVIGAVGLGAFLFYKIYTGRQQDDSNKKIDDNVGHIIEPDKFHETMEDLNDRVLPPIISDIVTFAETNPATVAVIEHVGFIAAVTGGTGGFMEYLGNLAGGNKTAAGALLTDGTVAANGAFDCNRKIELSCTEMKSHPSCDAGDARLNYFRLDRGKYRESDLLRWVSMSDEDVAKLCVNDRREYTYRRGWTGELVKTHFSGGLSSWKAAGDGSKKQMKNYLENEPDLLRRFTWEKSRWEDIENAVTGQRPWDWSDTYARYLEEANMKQLPVPSPMVADVTANKTELSENKTRLPPPITKAEVIIPDSKNTSTVINRTKNYFPQVYKSFQPSK